LRGIVVLGNSRSPGPGSWVDGLIQRGVGKIAVANRSQTAGALYIGRFGEADLARFDRDVLASAGVTHVIVESGNNDLIVAGRQNQWTHVAGGKYNLATVGSVSEIMSGFRQIIERAHEHGINVIATTIAPFEGANYWSPERNAGRERLNNWMRSSGEFDGLIDFDLALRDPAKPTRMRSEFDSGNHREPSAKGHEAMAAAVNMQLFE
jgi:lysophospholipase L1-like esterase